MILVKKYHDSHCEDKEMLISIRKAVEASPELRSKKALIETFISGINDVSDVLLEWRNFIASEKEKELDKIISDENLRSEETKKFIDNSFRDGGLKTFGTDLDKIMPPVSRFGGKRDCKKQIVINRLSDFYNKYSGIL